jgi:DNA-binding transcriptional LysR family regulator
MLSRQLEYLVALAHERHFAHAAERCSISQPALSLAIKQLEAELGVTIVERGNRFRGFTREGDIVLRWARRMLADEQTLKVELASRSGSLTGRLRVGVIPTATAVCAALTTGFLSANPKVALDVAEGSSTEILRGVLGYDLDAAISYVDDEPTPPLRALPVAREEYALVMPEAGPGAPAHITWREAAALPLCLLGAQMQNRRIIDALLHELGVAAAPRVETNSLMSAYCYVRSGWSSILPRSYLDWIAIPPRAHIATLVDPEIAKSIGLIIADRDPLPMIVAALWEHAAGTEGPARR